MISVSLVEGATIIPDNPLTLTYTAPPGEGGRGHNCYLHIAHTGAGLLGGNLIFFSKEGGQILAVVPLAGDFDSGLLPFYPFLAMEISTDNGSNLTGVSVTFSHD